MDCNWELEKDGRGDHIVITCYDNAGHMDADQIFVVNFDGLVLKYPNICCIYYCRIYMIKIAHKQTTVNACFVSQKLF